MRRAKQGGERGVISVVAAFLVVAVMGMLALAVDVGYSFGQRRLAQNVADRAALAGTRVVAERLMNKPQTDANVLAAIRDVARNSSGGFLAAGTTGAYDPTNDKYTAVYVADANSDGVPEAITCPTNGVPCLKVVRELVE